MFNPRFKARVKHTQYCNKLTINTIETNTCATDNPPALILSQLWDSNPRPSRYECDALPTKLNWQRISFG